MAEINYQFRQHLLEVHKPGRRNPEAALEAGHIALDGSWRILLPAGAGRVLYNAARDLEDYLFLSMGISLPLMTANGPEDCHSRSICYALDNTLEADSYRLSIEADCITLCGADERSAAQAGYFIEDLMNLAEAPFLKLQQTVRKPLYSPRMIHSGFGLDIFPDGHLSAIAHAGINAILIFVKDIDITPHGYLDFNDLIYRAAGLGIDVYAYSYMINMFHPDDEGAEAACENLYGRLFDRCPGFKGIVFVGESCGFPSRDPHTTGIWPPKREDVNADGSLRTDRRPSPGWWPCSDYPQWLNLIKRVIRSRRPDADIVFWTYNWGYVEEKYRLELLRNIPTDISLLVTFEMFEDVEREGGISRTVDYTLFFEGPGQYFISEAKLAKSRGIRLYAMTNTGGLTWDIGMIPYEPAPYQWMRRYRAMRQAHDDWGLCGTMDSHHFGLWPSFISDLAKWAFYTPSPDSDEVLRQLAARDFGAEHADKMLQAYEYFSEGIRYLISTNEDQYGPFRVGPSFPLLLFRDADAKFPSMPFAHFGGNKICNPQYDYDLSTPERFDKINREIKCLTRTGELYERGYRLLEEIYPQIAARKQADAARLINMCKFIVNCVRTTVNVKEWRKLKVRLRNESVAAERQRLMRELRLIGERELANAAATIPLVEFDSRLGFEPSMEYMCDKEHLQWKIDITRRVLEEELPELLERH